MTALLGKLCTFRVGAALYGVDVARVQEIVREQPMTRVPLAPPALRGLINLRGQIVPAVDLRTCLGLPARDSAPINIVVEADDGAVSFLVDDVGDVIDLDSDAFEPPPDNLHGAMRELLDGVYKLEHELLSVLNADAVIAVVATRRGRAPEHRGGVEGEY